jgi:dienelactone hydrolase
LASHFREYGTTMARIGLGVVLAALALACAPTLRYVEPVEDVSFPVKASVELSGLLYRPNGRGPFPAVVLMHGCAGLAGSITSMENVALLLRDSGYVALVVDSFFQRGVHNVCDNPAGKSPSFSERVDDAFAARRYLSSLAFVDSSRIGLVGWSHGGITALITWTQNSAVSGTAPFAAIAAYYPYCSKADVSSASAPLLILIGERDDWTPAFLCQDLVANATALGRDTSITIYPGATHAFDSVIGGKSIEVQGHRLTPDPAAGRDSRERLLAFFGRTLKRP